jgi:hypothetical protein
MRNILRRTRKNLTWSQIINKIEIFNKFGNNHYGLIKKKKQSIVFKIKM